jgi:tetratricopeptide (TPR) repeat protein
MTIPMDTALMDSILEKLRTFERERILEAIALSDGLPAAGEENADDVAQILHDIALYTESLGELDLCATLYQRALAYRVANAQILAGSWYRYGLCLERMGKLREAVRAYRSTFAYGGIWPEVDALARRNLARLLASAEEYEEAAGLFAHLLKLQPIPESEIAEMQLSLATCFLRLRRYGEALPLLNALSRDARQDELSVRAGCLWPKRTRPPAILNRRCGVTARSSRAVAPKPT